MDGAGTREPETHTDASDGGRRPALVVERIVADANAPETARRLHDLEHAGRLETVELARADTARRRLRIRTDRGRDCGISLPRDSTLFDGAVLHLSSRLAVVVRVQATRWLALAPDNAATALELGYHAGNLHWRVRFDGGRLLVALDDTPESYLARLRDHVADAGYAWEVVDAER
jgi:urease accessory protein